MKKKSSIILISICALLVSSLNAQAANQKISAPKTVSNAQEMPDPAQLLETAMAFYSQPGSVRIDMICKNGSGNETSLITDRKTLSDGVVFEKTVPNSTNTGENEDAENKLNMVVLNRPEGMYNLFPQQKKALYLKFLSDIQRDSMALITASKRLNKTASNESAPLFTIRLGTYAGKQCYIIEERISQEVQKSVTAAVNNNASLKKVQNKAKTQNDVPTPALNIYYVSIPESKLLRLESYDSEANLLSSMQYNSITEMEFAHSYFDIPEDYETLEITTIDEMGEKMVEIITGM